MIPRLVQLLVKAHQDAQRHVAAGTQQPYTVSIALEKAWRLARGGGKLNAGWRVFVSFLKGIAQLTLHCTLSNDPSWVKLVSLHWTPRCQLGVYLLGVPTAVTAVGVL